MKKTSSTHHFSSPSLRVTVVNNYIEPDHSTASINIVSSKMETQLPESITFCEDLSLELADVIKSIKALAKELSREAEKIPFEADFKPDWTPTSAYGGKYVCLANNEFNVSAIRPLTKACGHEKVKQFSLSLSSALSPHDVRKIFGDYLSTCNNRTHSSPVVTLWYAPTHKLAQQFVEGLYNIIEVHAFLRETKPK